MYKKNITDMNFFDGLQIPLAGCQPRNTGIFENVPKYYSIQFNYSGNFFLQVGNRKKLYSSGSVAFLTYPGEHFLYGTDLPGGHRYHCYICTCGPRVKEYIQSGLFRMDPENPLVPIANGERFLRGINQLIECCRDTAQQLPRGVLIFEDLLLQIYENRMSIKYSSGNHLAYLKSLTGNISADPEKNVDFQECAAECGVTMIHFRRIFKEYAGVSPQQFLLRARLNKAAELLRSTRLSIKEIAYLSGWEDEYYFSRQFRKKFQISPQRYRREITG
jgi:AraC-like DNA-binding protein